MFRLGVALIVLGGATKFTIKTYRKIKNREFFNSVKSQRSFYKGGFASVMTRREAQLILNVREGATADKIRENHRRLMLLNHPDNGYPQNPFNPYATPSSHYPQRKTASGFDMGYSPAPRFESNAYHMENAFKDIQNKYDTQVNSNLRTGAALSELEMILEAERRKTKEIKDKLEADLEAERRLRVDFENKLIRLKDDSLKREMLLSELGFKSNNFAHENESLLAENNSLKEELVKYQELYNMKLREMEEKFNNQSRRMMILEEEYSQQLEKVKQEQKNYLDELNNDWDKRYRALDEKHMKLLTIKQDLENEIKRLNDVVLRIKVEAEESIRETIGKIQEEEYRKYMSNIKALESKLMASEENKAALSRKNQEFINELQAKDRELRQSQMYMENANNKYKQELSDLQNQFTQVEIMVSKYRTELGNKDNVISRMEAEFTEMNKALQKQKEMSKNEIDSNLREFSNEKRYLEDTIDQQKRKIMELEGVLAQQEGEFARVKAEYERICNMLQNNINKTIFQTMTDASYPSYAAKSVPSRLGASTVAGKALDNNSNKLIFKYE